MELLIFAMLLSWGVTRYGVTEAIATAKGTTPPRMTERMNRDKLAHERHMQKLRHGPTFAQHVGRGLGQRLEAKLATPKERRTSTGPGDPAFRRYVRDVWTDAWNDAVTHHQHRMRKKADGDLPRQKAWQATKNAATTVFAHRSGRNQDSENDPSGETSGATGEPRVTATSQRLDRDPDAPENSEGPATPPEPPEPAEETDEPDDADVVTTPSGAVATVDESPQSPGEAGSPEDDTPTDKEDTTPPENTESQTHPDNDTEGAPLIMSETQNLASGETVDPQSALTFVQGVTNVAQQLLVELETSIASLSEHNVTGEPIAQLEQMQEAASTLVANSTNAASYFESHIGIQDVAQSDTTVGGGRYLGIGS